MSACVIRRATASAVAVVASTVLVAGLSSTAVAAPVSTPTLVDIRAAHHEGYDRVVFEFSGAIPQDRAVGYVPELAGDGSGKPIPMPGDAILAVRFSMATGHDGTGQSTYGPNRRAFALPNVMSVVSSGDFEGVLSFGVALATQTPYRVSTLTGPSRVVIDIDTPFSTVTVRDYFIRRGSLEPVAVTRPVIPPATAKGALQRLFAGPTQAEQADGLMFVSSDATGFTGLSITNGLAKVTLKDGCNSHGGTTSIATEIFLVLKQFSTVRWVKIYDPAGRTEQPAGNSDSIPECLEP